MVAVNAGVDMGLDTFPLRVPTRVPEQTIHEYEHVPKDIDGIPCLKDTYTCTYEEVPMEIRTETSLRS